MADVNIAGWSSAALTNLWMNRQHVKGLLVSILTSTSESGGWLDLLVDYCKSLVYVSVRVLPLLLLGIFVSMWIMRCLPSNFGAASGAHAAMIVVIAFFAVLLTLPSFFEIPLALSFLAAGGPAGAAAALLFAGPAINIPSLLVIGRSAGWKLAASVALVVWCIGAVGGLLLG